MLSTSSTLSRIKLLSYSTLTTLSPSFLLSPWRYFLVLVFESPAKYSFPLCMVTLQYSKDICSFLRANPNSILASSDALG